ncbi:hypothetical protein FOXB_17034 [Fusarium oxysporum f. sp. conglutinans Fo5176]|uniref:Uncharacterized protein n=1 Tax=Fusarium oxysporum (strain Fo5176) TaxID=660025 RepID=F9GEF0_FUSOF|nr:hypothetical protein FOXB_17034 [Fusarium oxysporum f. sp. conglutinans Fo5176]
MLGMSEVGECGELFGGHELQIASTGSQDMLAEAWIRYFKVTNPDGPPPITATLIAKWPMLNLVDFLLYESRLTEPLSQAALY